VPFVLRFPDGRYYAGPGQPVEDRDAARRYERYPYTELEILAAEGLDVTTEVVRP
jgi:hypothetical protein